IIQITSELNQGEITTDWDMQFTTGWVAYPAATNFSHLFSSQSMPKILIARGFTVRYEME
ncbi:MAG: hypothetical protein AAF806_31120, partial [Bacteroidota bacterium]